MVKRSTSGRVSPPAGRPKNKLLAALPPEDFARILPHLKTIPIKVRQVLYRRGEPVRQVFFPNGGGASITAAMNDGAMVEIATVGTEGMVGMNAFFGGGMLAGETMIQVPDTSAEAMGTDAFQKEIDRQGAFHDGIRRYSQGLLTLLMQSTACMALHHVQERCCRWLLMTHDRVGRDEFDLSHEFLAMMLGSTRPTVSVVAATLQKAGLIRYTHGHITIADRQGLERSSCECYSTVKGHFDRLGL